MITKLKEVLERAASLPAQLAEVRRGQAGLELRFDEVIACFRRERERQRQFVALLAFAQNGARETLVGLRSGVLRTPQQQRLSLDLHVDSPVERVGLVVFCDLERVHVHGLYVGNQLLGFAYSSQDSAPIGWAESVHPSIILRAHVGLREAE